MSEVDKITAASRQFETAILERDTRLKKAGWIVSGLFFIICIIMGVAIVVMLPLKQTITELYSLDKQTGRIEYMTTVKESELSESDVLNKAETAAYVVRRERYNYFALQKDYNDTQLFNSDKVNQQYLDLFNSDHSPDIIYEKAGYVVNIDVISNVHSDATAPDRLATLRVKRTIRRISDGTETTDFMNIRLTYRYVPSMELTDAEREINPLGFIVTSYQRDKDLRTE
ncbi:type IV secretion system protein VirB8 [Klebsiella pneumoniae]|uniref:virB8 family protein n=1 Tax=Enterobacteriaceae TaxID=543 RepID=UPI0009AF55C8|nr:MULTISPECIES: type IV secretion system protein [Enterobacteriaceae]EKS9266609.1 type IV secretion system protein [Salmonella enterica]ELF6824438.1 type IV secretion system protein [Salmonella enterica]SYT49022.1 type IV secretion system protein VirB8 [Klebsiella pneumoniae]SYU11980.1 type IV secretion system protein VirB8 [Klebsiella pneumoniae]